MKSRMNHRVCASKLNARGSKRSFFYTNDFKLADLVYSIASFIELGGKSKARNLLLGIAGQ